MYKFFALLLIAFAVADACVTPWCEYRPSCTSNRLCSRVGYFAYPYNNRLFYYCSSKWRNVACLRCPAHLVYSAKCGQCLYRSDASRGRCSSSNTGSGSGSGSVSGSNCVNPWACEHLENGIQSVKSDNTKFFFCSNGKPTQCQSCPKGLVFSGNCKVCVNTDTDCNTAGGPNGGSNGGQPIPLCGMNKLCWDVPAGSYNFPRHGIPSRLFYQCNDRKQNVGCQRCPAGLYYSKKCAQCLYFPQAKHNICSGSGGGSGSGSGSGSTDFCAPKGFCHRADVKHRPANYLFADKEDNTKFFSCISNKATQCQSCAASLVFNEVCQACMRFKTDKKNECGTANPNGAGPDVKGVERCAAELCKGRAVGDYEFNSKSETYITCVEGGKCIKRWCQAHSEYKLVYSKACESCNARYITDPALCNQAPPTPKGPPGKPKVPQCKAPAHYCEGKKHGLSYSPPKEANEPDYVFYVCDPKQNCFRKACQTFLLYNDAIKGCDYRPKKETHY